MSARDVALGLLVSVLWGVAFVATRIGLDSFTPAQLAALRFLIACVPVLALPRPPIGWPMLIATGLTLYAGQFLLQFFGIAAGMPPGLASLVVHTQAFFTVAFAAIVLRERPTARHMAGMALALAGLLVILATTGDDLTMVGFVLTLGSAVSWGIGNIFLKRAGATAQLALTVWLSAVVPVPALAISAIVDGPQSLGRSPATATWGGWAAAIYLGLIGTLVAYTLWARLLARYPAATVAPFALLVPFVGGLSSAVVFGEQFGPLRLAGMAGVLAGLAVIVVPFGRWARPVRAVPLALVLLVLASPASAVTGAEWRRYSEAARRAYVDGVIDAWHGVADVQDSLGTPDRGIVVFREIAHCLRERLIPSPQIFRIVERHVEDNPGLATKDMADLMFSALSQACRR